MSHLPDLTKLESKWLSARHSAHRAQSTAFAVRLLRRGQTECGEPQVLDETARSLRAYADCLGRMVANQKAVDEALALVKQLRAERGL